MDTGSEFAYMMSKLGVDLFKDASLLLKEIILMIYHNKSAREKFLMDSGNFEKLALKTKEFTADTISLEDMELFSKYAKKTDLKYGVPTSVEGSGVAIVIYDKEQTEIFTDIMLNVEKEKLEKIADNKEENIGEVKGEKEDKKEEKEEKGIRDKLEKIREEKEPISESAPENKNINQVKSNKEMER